MRLIALPVLTEGPVGSESNSPRLDAIRTRAPWSRLERPFARTRRWYRIVPFHSAPLDRLGVQLRGDRSQMVQDCTISVGAAGSPQPPVPGRSLADGTRLYHFGARAKTRRRLRTARTRAGGRLDVAPRAGAAGRLRAARRPAAAVRLHAVAGTRAAARTRAAGRAHPAARAHATCSPNNASPQSGAADAPGIRGGTRTPRM